MYTKFTHHLQIKNFIVFLISTFLQLQVNCNCAVGGDYMGGVDSREFDCLRLHIMCQIPSNLPSFLRELDYRVCATEA